MNNYPIEELPWLLEAPADFRARLTTLKAKPELLQARDLQTLAAHRLNEVQLHGLSRLIDLIAEPKEQLQELTALRIAMVGSSTTQMITPALRGACLRHGLLLEVHEAEFGQIVQEAIDPASGVSRAKVDVVVVLLDHSVLPQTSPGCLEREQAEVAAAIRQIEVTLRGFNENAGAPVLISTIPKPALQAAGSLEQTIPGTSCRCLEEINRTIRQITTESPNYLFDLAALAELIGLSRWTDPGQWFTARLPFDQIFIPIVTEHLARVLGAIRGKTKKVLALDLDNTLWSGVIGDDGVEGVRVGQGDPVGEAHLELQRLALRYKQQGVILAVVSKNDEEVARQAFLELDGMALGLDDFAVFVANWTDKVSNLRFIAETLNVGTDSIVFVDDNPAERELVRQQMPEVSVPELPENPAFYAQVLSAAGYFEAVSFTAEDSRRTEMYQANQARQDALSEAGDLDGFLSSLEMKMSFETVDPQNLNRVTQLINKTNQFNLTTRRHSLSDVLGMVEDHNCFPYQVKLLDRFGDNGTISVIICREEDPGIWEIDTWLMSCRVLKRQVEDAALNTLVELAKARGVSSLRGRFSPTGRNGMVSEFFPTMGFSPLPDEQGPEEDSAWTLEIAGYQPKTHFITILQQPS